MSGIDAGRENQTNILSQHPRAKGRARRTLSQEFVRIVGEHNLSQTEVAELLGVSLTHVNGIVHGRNVPSEALLRSLRAHLGRLDPRLAEADAAIRDLPPEARERTLQLIAMLIEQVRFTRKESKK